MIFLHLACHFTGYPIGKVIPVFGLEFMFEKLIRKLHVECSQKGVGNLELSSMNLGYWNRARNVDQAVEIDLVALEKTRIKGAIRTDFILSAEIIVISLGTVTGQALGTQLAVLAGIALLMTVGVYGLVAGIVKLDDLGLHLNRQAAAWKQAIGRAILTAAPWLMKTLSVVGTAAMFLVGGGILVHGVPAVGHGIEEFAAGLGWVAPVVTNLAGALVGVVAGALVLLVVGLIGRLRGKKPQPA